MSDPQTQELLTNVDADRLSIGGNQPPSPFDDRKSRTETLIANANVWVQQVTMVESEEQAERASDFLAVLREAHRKNEELRKEHVAPLREATDAINIGFKSLSAPLDKATAAIKGLLQPWLEKKEKERRRREAAQREEADRLTQEAIEKAATAKTIEDEVEADRIGAEAEEKAAQAAATARDNVGVRGEVAGRSTGLRGAWKATAITDLSLALSAYSDHPDLTELLLRLASADARGGRRRIPGFKIEKVTSVG